MSLRSADALPLVLFLLVAAAPTAGTAVGVPDAGAGGPVSPAASPALAPHNDTLPPPEQVIRIDLAPGGNARWHVSVRIPLETRNDTAAFRELASRFEAGKTGTLTVDTFERAAARAAAASDRPMRVRDVNRSHAVENGTGVLTLSFTWTNFAATSGDRLVVGDAFNTSTGTWLPSLTDRQTLLVAPPQGYGVRSSPPVPVDNGVARWEGPAEFSGREPWIVYAGSAGTETTVTTTSGPGTTTTGPGPGDDDGTPSLLLLAASVGGGVVLVVAYLLRRGPDGLPGSGTGTEADSGAGAGDAGAADASDAAGPDEGTATPGQSAEGTPGSGETAGDATPSPGAGGAAADADTEESDSDDEDVDVALLSDEERVERLLERNGGRMKQASIVKETGWSNAKVSQLLSAMEEEGRIDKLRIGRENLISFPEEDITDFDSE